jgi:methylated-DNA-[protein]-cysteine S-methyltransferase
MSGNTATRASAGAATRCWSRPIARLTLATPFGPVTLTEAAGGIARLDRGGNGTDETPLLVAARDQLDAYFAGRLRRFTLPLAPRATPFRHGLFEALFAIPYGETRSCHRVARGLGTSPQAVGRALAANPLPVLIPCHRVAGAHGPGKANARLALRRLEAAAILPE